MKVKTHKVRLGNIDVLDFNAVPAAPLFDTSFTTQIRVKNTNWGPNEFDAANATSFSNLGNELSSGMLTLSSKTKLTGKVELMFIMKKKKSATMDCTMKFDLSSKATHGLECK
ncbi:unnamed protein product [Prunus armeniaca]|uniref:Late embryogenesis abundant protein LEA-2 subgroup domain-containing protein n=1 Tax=Prunus armeniaca TaxID=36596 RepID=A0A6J5UTR3_PRUAR|nr:unnamed protein product [Prunus armeniaca]